MIPNKMSYKIYFERLININTMSSQECQCTGYEPTSRTGMEIGQTSEQKQDADATSAMINIPVPCSCTSILPNLQPPEHGCYHGTDNNGFPIGCGHRQNVFNLSPAEWRQAKEDKEDKERDDAIKATY